MVVELAEDEGVVRHSRQLVTPLADISGKVECLSGNDQGWSKSLVFFGYRFPSLLCLETLVQGLRKALDTYPYVAGRLDVSSPVYTIHDFMAGVDLESIERKNDPVEGSLPTAESYTDVWESAQIFPGVRAAGRSAPTGSLLYVKVILYPKINTTFMGFCFNHALGDSKSHMAFLREWSFQCKCKNEGLGSKLPKQRPGLPQDLGQRFGAPPIGQQGATLAATEEDLCKDFPRGSVCPLDREASTKLEASVRNAFDQLVRVEVVIRLQDLRALKEQVCREMKQGWVSSYEALAAVLLHAIGHTRGDGTVEVRSICEMRERGSQCPFGKNYFGNPIAAWTSEEFAVDRPVHDIARRFHDGLRGFLSDKVPREEQLKDIIWMTRAKDAGFGPMMWWTPIAEHLEGCKRVSLNWRVKIPFSDVDFGGGCPPEAIGWEADEVYGMWDMSPVNDEAVALRGAVPGLEAKAKLLQCLKESCLVFRECTPKI